jgi:very-short-patch-repair endonuclease
MPEPMRRPTRQAQQLRNSATPAERLLWSHLSKRQLDGWKFSRQMPIGPFICDFLCRELDLIVEVDGGQHCENPRDEARTAYLEGEGFQVVRYWNNDVRDNLEGVLESLRSVIRAHPLPPPASGRGKAAERRRGGQA